VEQALATSSASSRPDSRRAGLRTRLLGERLLQIARDKATFGSAHRRRADRDTARDGLLALAGLGREQDSGALERASSMPAVA
jgi:hypothetical protein